MSELLEREPAGANGAPDAKANARTTGSDGPALPDPFARAHRRVAWLVATLLAAGFVAALASLVTHARNGTAFDLDGWRDGSLGRGIDRALDVPYARRLHRAQAAVRYRMFGDLGLQVKEGCPGWLFYADGLRPPAAPRAGVPGADALLDARIASLHRYADALHRDGIRLVVVTVPDKARVESEALCGLQQDAGMTQRLDAWQHALDQAGVTRVDVLPALRAARPAYFRTDVHWNAKGAEAAAHVVGAAVLPLVGARGDARFAIERGPVEPRVGDLLTLAGLGDVSDAWRPAPDSVVRETIQPLHSGGLFDDGPAAEIMLAGSSFSRRSNFAERLGEQLGREVWNLSLDDGQFDRALQAMWSQRAAWPKSVRVVIWEMSEDALSASLPVDAQRDLAHGKQG